MTQQAPKPDPRTCLSQAQALVQSGQYPEAYEVVRSALPALHGLPMSTWGGTLRELRRIANLVHPVWWSTLGDSHLRMRRTRADDAAFYAELFADPDWARRYNRQRPWQGDLGRALEQLGRKPPLELGNIHWIIENRHGQPEGVMSLTKLDTVNKKAEIAIGMRQGRHSTLSTRAFFHALRFAFESIDLNRVYAQIYTDNPLPRALLTRLGFTEEGLLRDHYFLPPGQFFDVWVLGMTRKDWQSNSRLQKTVASATKSRRPKASPSTD